VEAIHVNAERFWSKVEKTETCWVWTAATDGRGYGCFAVTTLGRNRVHKAHRVSWALVHGQVEDRAPLDHICHNKMCVRPEHLRLVTNKQNSENRSGLRSDNQSGLNGVWWDSRRKKWAGMVQHNGKPHFAGRFSVKEEADAATRSLRLHLFTHNTLDQLQNN
jgi:hypothetical protein